MKIFIEDTGLDLSTKKFWFDIEIELKKHLEETSVYITYDEMFNQVLVEISMHNIKKTIQFSYPENINDKGIIQHMLNGIQLYVYELVFKQERID
jgi:hypothetical protein